MSACAYCNKARAVNKDHVIPQSVARKYRRPRGKCPCPEHEPPGIPYEWLDTVPACFACNMRKGARRLVPPSWADRVPALNEFFGGTEWRVWSGDPNDPVFTSVAQPVAGRLS